MVKETDSLGGRETKNKTDNFVCNYHIKAARLSKQRPKLSVSFSSYRPPKLSVLPDINLERTSWLVVMETGSLVQREQ